MKQNLTNPVEMHGPGAVVAASVAVTVAAALLVLALQWPALLLVGAAGAVVASRARRTAGGVRHRRDADQRDRLVCSAETGTCVKV